MRPPMQQEAATHHKGMHRTHGLASIFWRAMSGDAAQLLTARRRGSSNSLRRLLKAWLGRPRRGQESCSRPGLSWRRSCRARRDSCGRLAASWTPSSSSGRYPSPRLPHASILFQFRRCSGDVQDQTSLGAVPVWGSLPNEPGSMGCMLPAACSSRSSLLLPSKAADCCPQILPAIGGRGASMA
jgi:hypothetical protein